MITIVNLALRAFQALFGIVVLGLSITLIKGQGPEGEGFQAAPASYSFAAFAGAISLVGALLGVAGTWIELLQGALMFGIDGLLALINIAGGVLLAIKLKGANCSNTNESYQRNTLMHNDLLNGGTRKDENGDVFGYFYWTNNHGKQNERCRSATADSAFMLMTVILLVATVLVTWLRLKNHK